MGTGHVDCVTAAAAAPAPLPQASHHLAGRPWAVVQLNERISQAQETSGMKIFVLLLVCCVDRYTQPPATTVEVLCIIHCLTQITMSMVNVLYSHTSPMFLRLVALETQLSW